MNSTVILRLTMQANASRQRCIHTQVNKRTLILKTSLSYFAVISSLNGLHGVLSSSGTDRRLRTSTMISNTGRSSDSGTLYFRDA